MATIIDGIKRLFGGAPSEAPQSTKDAPREVSEDEKAEVKVWAERLKRADQSPERQAWLKTCGELRQAVKGIRNGQVVKENLVLSTLNVILPRIYAKAPTIAARPAERVSSHEYPWLKDLAKTLELLVNQQLGRAHIKQRGKSWVRAAMTVAIGWLKATYQRDYETDPETTNRIADTQDNLARIERLVAEIDAGEHETAEELADKQAELKDQLESLQASLEVSVQQGMVLDVVDNADLIVADGIGCMDEYLNAGFIAQRVWPDEDEFKTKYKMDVPEGALRYDRQVDAEAGAQYSRTQGEGKTGEGKTGRYLCVYEVWDRRAQVIRTMLEGAKQWVRPPYRIERNGKRFYPYFMLAFNWVDGEAYPVSDVSQWLALQDEVQERDVKRSDFVKAYKAGLVGNKGSIDKANVEQFVTAGNLDVTLLDVDGPIGNVLMPRPNPPYDQAIYDTTDVRARLDIVSGAGDAQRGGVLKAKTATEAGYIEQGLSVRSEDRLDVVEDTLAELGTYVMEILLQELTKDQVLVMVGGVKQTVPPTPDEVAAAELAGTKPVEQEVVEAVWPELDREQIYNLVQIEVEAGSTGRPNKMAEREAWATAFPLIQEAMMKVMEYRQMGQQQAAKALIKLVDHSLRILDERLTVEMFIPDANAEELPPPDPMQLEYLQAQLDDLRAGTAQKRSTALKNVMDSQRPDPPARPPGKQNGAPPGARPQ